MFSALGSKRERGQYHAPNQLRRLSRISEATKDFSSEESSETNWISQDKRQRRRQGEDGPTALSELSNTGICEMEAVDLSEMDADWQFSQELPNSEVSGVRNEPHNSLLRSKPSATWSFMSTSPAPRQVSPRTSRVSRIPQRCSPLYYPLFLSISPLSSRG